MVISPPSSDSSWNCDWLAAWLDSQVEHVDQPQRVTAVYFKRLVEVHLARGIALSELVRHKSRLRDAARDGFNCLRVSARKAAAKALSSDRSVFQVGWENVMEFSEKAGCAPDNLYGSAFGTGRKFSKHFYAAIGEMNEEERRVAELLDHKANAVKVWARNL